MTENNKPGWQEFMEFCESAPPTQGPLPKEDKHLAPLKIDTDHGYFKLALGWLKVFRLLPVGEAGLRIIIDGLDQTYAIRFEVKRGNWDTRRAWPYKPREIAERTGIPHPTVIWAMRQLIEARIIIKDETGALSFEREWREWKVKWGEGGAGVPPADLNKRWFDTPNGGGARDVDLRLGGGQPIDQGEGGVVNPLTSGQPIDQGGQPIDQGGQPIDQPILARNTEPFTEPKDREQKVLVDNVVVTSKGALLSAIEEPTAPAAEVPDIKTLAAEAGVPVSTPPSQPAAPPAMAFGTPPAAAGRSVADHTEPAGPLQDSPWNMSCLTTKALQDQRGYWPRRPVPGFLPDWRQRHFRAQETRQRKVSKGVKAALYLCRLAGEFARPEVTLDTTGCGDFERRKDLDARRLDPLDPGLRQAVWDCMCSYAETERRRSGKGWWPWPESVYLRASSVFRMCGGYDREDRFWAERVKSPADLNRHFAQMLSQVEGSEYWMDYEARRRSADDAVSSEYLCRAPLTPEVVAGQYIDMRTQGSA